MFCLQREHNKKKLPMIKMRIWKNFYLEDFFGEPGNFYKFKMKAKKTFYAVNGVRRRLVVGEEAVEQK